MIGTVRAVATAFAMAASAAASAATITFEGPPIGPGFTGPVTEGGFTYSCTPGALYMNGLGNPGNDIEGTEAGGGGVLDVKSATASTFKFYALEYAAYGAPGTLLTISLAGFRSGSLVGSTVFTLPATYGPYAWTSFTNGLFGGHLLDDLQITLPAGTTPFYSANIDNLTLTTTSSGTPEPASWALLVLGFGLTGVAVRRGRAIGIALSVTAKRARAAAPARLSRRLSRKIKSLPKI